jgi:hypothetical protein
MATSYSPKIVTDGLVLCLDAADKKSYSGSGTTWTDRSRNSKHGTLTNGPTFDSENGGVLVFDGSNDYIQSSVTGNMSTTDYTVTINAKYVYHTPSNTTFWGFSEGGSQAYKTFCFQTWNGANNQIMFFNGNGSSYQSQIFTPTGLDIYSYNEYTFVILSSGNISLYINGELYNTWTGNTYRNSDNFDRVWVATRIDQTFRGNVANFKVYNRALTDTEVVQNYNATKGRFGL